MSATRFKVGDKVRVCKGLELERSYGGYLFTSSMERLVDEVDEWFEVVKEDKNEE